MAETKATMKGKLRKMKEEEIRPIRELHEERKKVI